MAAAEAVGVVRVDRVAVLARNPDAVPPREDVAEHVLAEPVDEAEGRVHVADRPRGKAVLRMRHVVGAEEAAQVGEREHLAGHRDEDAVADPERRDLALDLVAGGGSVRGHRELLGAVVRVAGPRREDAGVGADREQLVGERDADVLAVAPDRFERDGRAWLVSAVATDLPSVWPSTAVSRS